MTIRRTLIAALAAAALISPAARAEPPDMHASTALAAAKANAQAEPLDMHASTALAAAKARENRVDSQSRQPPAGRPASPASPAAPATDGGSPVPVILIVAGGLGLVITALTARYGLRRSSHRSRIAA